MTGITFAHQNILYLLLLIPAMIAWYIYKLKESKASLPMSSLMGFKDAPFSIRVYLRHIPFALRMVALAFIIIVIARPQSTSSWRDVITEGIDIMISLDISSSMLAHDFKPDRIEAAKDLAIQFVSGRPNDRMGFSIFAGESFTLCPLTTDHASLINIIKGVELGLLADGTAIGSGLATAVARLVESDADSRVVILLTDGVNNTGEIAPLTAAEIAKTYGVRVYAIAVGSHGTAPYPVRTPFGVQYRDMPVEIDEEVLMEIARITGGKFFRATDNRALEKVYEEIDELERSQIEVSEHSRRREEFRLFGLIALALLATDVLLRYTLLRSIP